VRLRRCVEVFGRSKGREAIVDPDTVRLGEERRAQASAVGAARRRSGRSCEWQERCREDSEDYARSCPSGSAASWS